MPFRAIDDPVKLRRLMSAMLLLEEDLGLPAILAHLVEEARSIVGARYGALGVLNEDRTALAQFFTSGLTAEQERAIGPRPTGQGVLGLLIKDPRPLRLADIGAHPDSYGFPPNHPAMSSFLGVPVKVRDEIYGNLYLSEKEGWPEFTKDDEALIEGLALAAGIAIESAQLHDRIQLFAVDSERDRIARDLHDDVIQRLFAVGLSLQGLSRSAEADGLADRLARAVADIDDTIRQIRSTIFELGTAGAERSLRVELFTLARELDQLLGFEVQVRFDGPVDTAIPEQVAEHLVHVTREALTNVGRHAQATEASVTLTVANGSCQLRVVDNGVGLGTGDRRGGSTEGGLGLVNMRRRAEKLGGEMTVEDLETGGTVLNWRIPLTY